MRVSAGEKNFGRYRTSPLAVGIRSVCQTHKSVKILTVVIVVKQNGRVVAQARLSDVSQADTQVNTRRDCESALEQARLTPLLPDQATQPLPNCPGEFSTTLLLVNCYRSRLLGHGLIQWKV